MREFQQLITIIEKLVPLTDQEIDTLGEALQVKTFKKESLVTRQGEIENYVYFIVEGCLRNFCVHNGEDFSLDFYFSGSFNNSYTSFLLREKSTINIQALVDTKTLRIHHSDLSRLYQSSFSINALGRIITEQLYIRRTRREFSFITQSAKERYEKLLSENKDLVQHIPQKYLASYLGVKAESLSRIKAALKNNRTPS